jgi:hypothetical protein
MLNGKLFSIGNIVIIGAIAVATHIFAKPIYNMVDGN